MTVMHAALLSTLIAAFVAQGSARSPASLHRYDFSRPLMGTMMRIVLYAATEDVAASAADAAFGRIAMLDAELSDYHDSSELMRLSRSAGTGPVPISDDLFRVLRASQQLFRRSGGAFDVTVGPLSVLWRRARRQMEMPDSGDIAAARGLVGGDDLALDEEHRTAALRRRGMRLDLGGIAKGFAADEAACLIEQRGVTAALVAAGGDIRVLDSPPGSNGWRIAVASLGAEASSANAPTLMLHRAAVSTSGDAEQFVTIDGIRYSHIIDPRTGSPKTTRTAVTVIARDATTTDGLATAVAVLGREEGLRLVDETPDAAAIISQEDANGVQSYESRRWSRRRTEP